MESDSYVECPACGKVIFRLPASDEPAPCCGASGESRIIWPSLEVHKFLEFVYNQDFKSFDERRIAIVFLCAALELLLEQSIWKLLGAHVKSREVAEFVIDITRGRDKRIQLYNELSDCPLGNLLESKGIPTFLNDWNRLSKLRDNIIHGNYYADMENETDPIQSVLQDCLKVFAEVHNDVQRIIQAKSNNTSRK